ncbi:MAG TPA: hypothetical protein VL379_04365, partial [Pseudomonadales bacterium]|nr:hypothetical protein [Pseudomonadales bacterium]
MIEGLQSNADPLVLHVWLTPTLCFGGKKSRPLEKGGGILMSGPTTVKQSVVRASSFSLDRPESR